MTKTLPRAVAPVDARFAWVWALLWPVRCYLRNFPLQRGKGLLLRHLLLPLLPAAPAEFETELPGGARIRMQYRETIGWSSLLYGPFEKAELLYVHNLVQPGDTVFDVGANIGLFSVVLGRAVGSQGRVIAAEPVPENAVRAQANFRLNRLPNVELVNAAMGAAEGRITLNLANDSAYPSMCEVAESRGIDQSIEVQLLTLDKLWREMGSPAVRFIKIDVEGAELDVLLGAIELLSSRHPVLLLEANDAAAIAALREMLDPMGYSVCQPEGFAKHNYLAKSSERSLTNGTKTPGYDG